MAEPNRVEREFGVPFPGRILDPDRWAQTALKAMPAGHLDWPALFGRAAPVVLDVGCGNGRYLIGSALARPDHDHLGVDVLPVVLRYARKRGNQRGLANLKFAVLGGRELLADHVAPHSVAEVHCYHPQPYYDPAKVHLRLITPSFLATVHRALAPGGRFVIQTDNPGYSRYICAVVPVFFEFQELEGRWPDAPRGRTRREIIATQKKLPVFRGEAVRKPDLSEAEAVALAESLPAPTFDADRRLRDLDRLA
ncbi:tRNA (guanine-N(7)-)-methyltransferase [Gemmata obscuriglobus]|uniref:tRNA (guanine(46)-N(7))-methyltransferase n=1 Tax=Gemmata obscuriglobus TaxID=114 RepID=A0A2Z3H0N5_9BACT|nr:methyltransferase domain-containing protein [Gemmata obscuriglobus]AWM37136.1 methyltransferase domain-containing protein [Gemmata obscuriglobus]QEG30135.1 tRNA (guanine-N(7)-)-methyltransferase [Gemmata obscuriglobus]VTS09456.1 trna (guanine-n -)-methyltransferase : Putative methyltransferase OS=Planctomyces limnophilus (strain ATCC 43296 / DSM 3776 / IFAM 1008 / 290) GN=Plim_2576 PE=4 SV=1: Methyltransf_4 [Gemmata obscuriglobus UQM 2246]